MIFHSLNFNFFWSLLIQFNYCWRIFCWFLVHSMFNDFIKCIIKKNYSRYPFAFEMEFFFSFCKSIQNSRILFLVLVWIFLFNFRVQDTTIQKTKNNNNSWRRDQKVFNDFREKKTIPNKKMAPKCTVNNWIKRLILVLSCWTKQKTKTKIEIICKIYGFLFKVCLVFFMFSFI